MTGTALFLFGSFGESPFEEEMAEAHRQLLEQPGDLPEARAAAHEIVLEIATPVDLDL